MLSQAPGTIVPDDLPDGPPYYFCRTGDATQAGQVLYGYQSTWLPQSLLEPARLPELADALVRASVAPLALAPRPTSYVNETDYFQQDWQSAFWGGNYPRLLEIKRRYDPDGGLIRQAAQALRLLRRSSTRRTSGAMLRRRYISWA